MKNKNKITDSDLLETITNLSKQKSSSNLGGGLFKLRLARKGQGKSGGYRTLLAYKHEEVVFFMYAFAKNEKGNLSEVELDYYIRLGKSLLTMDKTLIEDGLEKQIFFEVGI